MVLRTCKRKKNNLKLTKKKHKYLQKAGSLSNDISTFIKDKIDATKLEIDIINLSGKRHRMKLLDETVTDEPRYKEITRENLDMLHSLDMSKSILLGQVHSNYFVNIDYFYVPINSIICFLSDLNFGSMDLKTGLLKYFKDASEGPKLFEDIFDYRARLIEEEFQFNNDDIPEMSVSCYDVFKNSNWYYPGQLCPNSLISFSGYNIGNTDECYLYNIHLDNQSIKITNFDDHMGKDSEIYSMKHLCYTNQNDYKIFIISGCMMLNVNKPEIQENILDIKKIKYFNTKINIDVEKEYFTKDDPPTNSYQYYCVTHQNYIFNYKFYSAKNLISFYETQPEEIEIYDNRNRIVNEIIQKLNSAVPIPEKYIHFLQSLSFKELQLTILNLLTHLSSTHSSSAHTSIYLQTQILDRVFIKDYIERKIGVFQRYIYNFETKNYDPDIEKRALTYIKGKINDILLLESFFKNQESIDYHAKFHQMMAESLEFPEVYFIETILKGSIISPEKYKSMFFKRPVFDDFAYLEFPKYTGLQQITFKQSHLNGDVNHIVITSFNYTLMFQNCILESEIDFQNFYSCENLEFDSVQIKDSTFMINNKFPFLKNFKFCDVKEGGLSHIIFHEQIKLQLIMIKDSDIRIIQIISNLPALQKLHLINLPNLKLHILLSHLSNLQILHLQEIKIPNSQIEKLLNLPKLQRIILFSVSLDPKFTYQLLQTQVKIIIIRDTPIILDLTKVNREFEIETIQTDDSVTLKTLSAPWFAEKITFESL